jgi:prevent-host-death family protein
MQPFLCKDIRFSLKRSIKGSSNLRSQACAWHFFHATTAHNFKMECLVWASSKQNPPVSSPPLIPATPNSVLQVWSGLVYMSRMTLVTITEAKANLSKLIAMVERGEEVIIGRAGKPVATLSPVKSNREPRKLGTLKGQGWMAPDWKEWPEEEARALGIID